jgi:hypothetical protein
VEAALDAGQIERVIEKNILPATANIELRKSNETSFWGGPFG